MSSQKQVKRYLAYWFQLGKKVVFDKSNVAVLANPVILGERYSQEFEDICKLIFSPDSGDCYLEGTQQTVAELLLPDWEVEDCALCQMPIPIKKAGMPSPICPCNDLLTWPNTELPAPREPINSNSHLRGICDRLYKIQSNHQ
ncbi:MAG: hypothetical protein F6J86_00520 [Symploca sp. SIO1B1]|nr:hypothetical protein [Symploca sp. SIO2D2]NER92348.1 hypothetical protein [Symploca sp. SIO1B1]